MAKTDPHPKAAGRLHIEYDALTAILRWERNPKKHDKAGIHDSIQRFGYTAPMLRDETTGRLVEGHGRLDELQALKIAGKAPPEGIEVVGGEWHVPVIHGLTFKSEEEAEAYLLAANQLVIAGGWEALGVAESLARLQAKNIPVANLGWNPGQLEELQQGIERPGPYPGFTGQPSATPSPRKQMVTLMVAADETAEIETAVDRALEQGGEAVPSRGDALRLICREWLASRQAKAAAGKR